MEEPKTQKGKRTQKKILDSSIQLINERGFENVTLNDICEASGVAIGSFYHYFKSTNDILYEILYIEGKEMLSFYETLKDVPPPEALRRVLQYQMAYFEKKGKNVVAMLYTREILVHQGTTRIIALLPLPEILSDIIGKGQIAGLFDPTRPSDYYAMIFEGLLLAYSFTWISSDNDSFGDLARDHLFSEIKRMMA